VLIIAATGQSKAVPGTLAKDPAVQQSLHPDSNHFLQQFNAKSAKKVLSAAPEAMDYLFGYGWPGNVIQLENVIERAFALGVELVIQIEDLPAEIRTAGEISRMH
jgi:DNA-binding NtrC family response regulator